MIKYLIRLIKIKYLKDLNLLIRSIPYFTYFKYLRDRKYIFKEPELVIDSGAYKTYRKDVNWTIKFIHPRYYLAVSSSRKYFSFIGHKTSPYNIKLTDKIDSNIIVAKTLSEIFDYCRFGAALSWVSGWGSIKKIADQDCSISPYSPTSIIEYGPGIGINPIISSINYQNSRIISYDMPVMVKMQKNVHEYWNEKSFSLDKNRFEYFSNSKKLFKSIKSEKSLLFLAYWSFSESPIALRERFKDIFKISKQIIIVSNKNIMGIKNEDYFEDLSHYLSKTHLYKKLPLPIYDFAKDSYLSKHSIHCYWQK